MQWFDSFGGWLMNLPWGSFFSHLFEAGVLVAIVGYFLNERTKRRDLRIQHISDEKRELFGRILSALHGAADQLFTMYQFHRLAASRDEPIRNRIYKLIANCKLAGLEQPPDSMLVDIEGNQNHEAIDGLCWQYLNALLDRFHGYGFEFSEVIAQAEFLTWNRGVLRGAQEAFEFIFEQGRAIQSVETDEAMEEILDEVQEKISPVRSGLVEDFDTDFDLKNPSRRDEWPPSNSE